MVHEFSFTEMVALGSAGALSLEVIKAYELRGKLHFKKYQNLIRSPMFWILGVAFVLASGFIAWAFNESNPSAAPWQLVVSGMGAAALAKKFGEAISSNTRVDFGGSDAGDSHVELRDIFR